MQLVDKMLDASNRRKIIFHNTLICVFSNFQEGIGRFLLATMSKSNTIHEDLMECKSVWISLFSPLSFFESRQEYNLIIFLSSAGEYYTRQRVFVAFSICRLRFSH